MYTLIRLIHINQQNYQQS